MTTAAGGGRWEALEIAEDGRVYEKPWPGRREQRIDIGRFTPFYYTGIASRLPLARSLNFTIWISTMINYFNPWH